jgi:Malonate decarboxylase, alpha subunit, transporter
VFEFAIDIVLLARRSDGLRRAVRPHLERRIVPLLPTSQLCNVRDSDMDMTKWRKQRSERSIRLDAGSRHASGKMVSPESAKALLEAVIRPGDRVCVEGDNQKQADFLAEVLADARGDHRARRPGRDRR